MKLLRLSSIPLLLLAIVALFQSGCQSGDETEATQKVLREGPPPLDDPTYMDLGTFVVNMPDGKYYLKTTMSLAFTDSGPMEWMTARIPLVKDMIIRHLQSISVEQLEDLRYRQILKNRELV